MHAAPEGGLEKARAEPVQGGAESREGLSSAAPVGREAAAPAEGALVLLMEGTSRAAELERKALSGAEMAAGGWTRGFFFDKRFPQNRAFSMARIMEVSFPSIGDMPAR